MGVTSNPAAGFDVSVYLDETLIEAFEGITDVSGINSQYITFKGEALEACAGVNLSGGTDSLSVNADVAEFLDRIESIKFNTLCFPVDDESLKSACKTKIRYLRENAGKRVRAVIPDFNADYEGIINVTNSVKVEGKALTHAQATAWVAGADASASNTQSNTYKVYEGADSVVDSKTHEQSVAAINNGEFFFSCSDEGKVIVEYDINSLVTFDEKKSQNYRKNRIMRALDSIAESISLNFPPNKYSNSEIGWDIMDGMGRALLQQFLDAGTITNVSPETDFAVDRTRSRGDSTYFNVSVQPVDSAEKLYFTVETR